MRPGDISAVIGQMRRAHPELRQPVTWHGIRRVLHRLRVDVVIRPLTVDAKVIHMGGCAVIALNANLPARRHTYRLAHELGHIMLHGAMSDDGVVFNMTPCWPDDPREDEAEYFAAQLLMGPARRRVGPVDAQQLVMEFPRTRCARDD